MKRTVMFSLLALCSMPVLALAQATPAAAPSAAPVASVAVVLQRMDRDNDGKVDFEEYRNAMSRRFHALDDDGDGALATSEVPKEWLAVGAKELADGTISTEEFAGSLQPTFDAFDLDHDYSLNNDELAAFAQARAAQLDARP